MLTEQCGYRFCNELTFGVLPMKKFNGDGILKSDVKHGIAVIFCGNPLTY